MERWQKILSESITSLDELALALPIEKEWLRPVVKQYPLRITRSYLHLIQERNDPIWRQCIPDPREQEANGFSPDPLDEENVTVAPKLLHRYPDRVLLLVSSFCPTLCRFCTRKNRWKEEGKDATWLNPAMEYIEKNASIHEVILSGGDPLMLLDDELEKILARLRRIRHLALLRIHTRVPVMLPERITPSLCRILKRHHPLYVNTQFNHPREITPPAVRACLRLADAGIPLGNQTVLLKGVNDDPEVMKNLMQTLLTIRVRPYYLHQMDQVKGTSHFHTPVQKGLEIIKYLRGHLSGMATPSFVIDLPGGKGKVALLPDDVKREGKTIYLKNFRGETVQYVDPYCNDV